MHLPIHTSCLESPTLQKRLYEIGLVIRGNGGSEAFDWPAFTELCDRADLHGPSSYPALLWQGASFDGPHT